MSAGQPTAPQPGIGQTVVPYATFQEAFQKDPGQLQRAVQAATAQPAAGDLAAQHQMVVAWHDAMAELSKSAKPVLAKGDRGMGIMHTPQNDLAARVQTLLAKRATAKGQVGTLQPPQTIQTPSGDSFAPGVLFVKFC